MGLLNAIGNFLFGKNPDIFDENGRVQHHFTEEKWKDWNDRLKASADYNWRNHTAQENAKEPHASPNSVAPVLENPVPRKTP